VGTLARADQAVVAARMAQSPAEAGLEETIENLKRTTDMRIESRENHTRGCVLTMKGPNSIGHIPQASKLVEEALVEGPFLVIKIVTQSPSKKEAIMT